MKTSFLRIFTNSFTQASCLFIKLRIYSYELVRVFYVVNGLYCIVTVKKKLANTLPSFWACVIQIEKTARKLVG